MHGDKECPFSGVTNSGRVLEEGAGKRDLSEGAGVVVIDSCAEIKSIPLQWRNQFWQSFGPKKVPDRKAMLGGRNGPCRRLHKRDPVSCSTPR